MNVFTEWYTNSTRYFFCCNYLNQPINHDIIEAWDNKIRLNLVRFEREIAR